MLSREPTPLGSVYWMEASKRRQALEWLARDDLSAEERRELEAFATRWRTGTDVDGLERRRLLAVFERLERRLRSAGAAPDPPLGGGA